MEGLSMAEGEFIAQNQLIGVIPKFNHDEILLISGTFGPFKPQKPTEVPIWLALQLKKKGMWDVQAPGWMDEEILKNMIEIEKKTSESSYKLENKLPDYHFFEIAILLLHYASEDIQNHTFLRTLIEDLYELRRAKIIKNMKATSFKADRVKKLDNISFFEINMIRGGYFQEGYRVSFALWDLLASSKSKEATGDKTRQEEEQAYDDDF